MKKIIALSALASISLVNGLAPVNAVEYGAAPSNLKIVHKPFWLFEGDDADHIKNAQLGIVKECEEGSNFTVLDDNGIPIATHVDDNCVDAGYQMGPNDYRPSTTGSSQGSANDDFDSFLGDLFDIEPTPTQGYVEPVMVPVYEEPAATVDNTGNTEADEFLNIIFGTSGTTTTTTTTTTETTPEELFPAPELSTPSGSELFPTDTTVETEPVLEASSESEASTESEGLEDFDALLLDIFGRISEEELTYANSLDEFTLKGKELFKTISAYSNVKQKTHLGNIEVSLLEGEEGYNSKMIEILTRVDNEFSIDSIKNDFAKNIGNLSYSLVNYKNSDLDLETKEGFKNKIIKDIVKIETKYKTLKRKDMIISRSLANKNSL